MWYHLIVKESTGMVYHYHVPKWSDVLKLLDPEEYGISTDDTIHIHPCQWGESCRGYQQHLTY